MGSTMKMPWKITAWFLAGLAAAVLGFTAYVITQKSEVKINEPLRAASISGKPLVISSESEKEITAFVDSADVIVGAQAISIDLIKNQRKTTFFKADNKELGEIWSEYISRKPQPGPAFSSEGSNDRVANIINGDFDCREFKRTVGYARYPEANKVAPWLCSISVPPGADGSGDFVGFLNFFLARPISATEKNQFSVQATELSTKIYQRDVAPLPSTLK